ncbi:MAG: ribose 5-phosphate isomerase A [Thermofilum sp. ex4484_15]|nr:MAG: ribose 5-phosphate isomerase A [Thermofilum sp. ex4484_15]
MEASRNSLRAKLNAVIEALRLIRDGMTIGVGSGSTINLFLRELAKRVKCEGLEVEIVPASLSTELIASELGIKVRPFHSVEELELAIDGADEVDEDLNLLKGKGGALAREKLIDYSSKEYVVIVDSSKLSSRIGEKAPLVIEVLPLAWKYVSVELERKFGFKPKLRIAKRKNGPIISDNGNLLLDCEIEGGLKDASDIEREVNSIPGVLENGIFSLRKPRRVIVGYNEGVRVLGI